MFFFLLKNYCKYFVCILIYIYYRVYNKPILILMSFHFVYVAFLATIILGSPKPHQTNNE
jgi:hypothetical protein